MDEEREAAVAEKIYNVLKKKSNTNTFLRTRTRKRTFQQIHITFGKDTKHHYEANSSSCDAPCVSFISDDARLFRAKRSDDVDDDDDGAFLELGKRKRNFERRSVGDQMV